MKNLLNLIIYIFQQYPNPSELSKPRLVKIIYLIDWRAYLVEDKPVTDIKWYFNHYGPYVDSVINLMRQSSEIFDIKSYSNMFGGISDKISLKDEVKNKPVEIDESTKIIADFVINKTYKLTWTDFINLIYSTYPIVNSSKYTELNLELLSKEYKHHLESSGIQLI